jgi:flagellin
MNKRSYSMSLVMNTNIASLTAQRYLSMNTQALNKSMQELSSGFSINSAADNPAGLALSEGLQSQINGDNQAANNTQDGINMLDVADGAMSTIENDLQSIRTLAVQASNDTYSATQRTSIATQINALISTINQTAESTAFNGTNLLSNANVPANFYLQIGANNSNTLDRLDVASGLGDVTTDANGLNLAAASVASSTAAQAYITTIDAAITTLNTKRAGNGALVNQLQSVAANLSSEATNYSASESQIKDTNVAAVSAQMTQQQILQQAAETMLAQANQGPTLALKLLQG